MEATVSVFQVFVFQESEAIAHSIGDHCCPNVLNPEIGWMTSASWPLDRARTQTGAQPMSDHTSTLPRRRDLPRIPRWLRRGRCSSCRKLRTGS